MKFEVCVLGTAVGSRTAKASPLDKLMLAACEKKCSSDLRVGDRLGRETFGITTRQLDI